MKYFLFVSLLLLIAFPANAQKVTVQVIKTGKAANSGWQVMDKFLQPVVSGNDYFPEDTALFILEANKRYFLHISVIEIYNPDTSLYSLRINGEPILYIRSKTEPGDYFYPFFTGVKALPSKITGGTNADIADFPWQVYFKSGNLLCGGSIISDSWVVTAAHCTRNENGSSIPVSSMAIIAGTSHPTVPFDGKTYLINEVIVHPGFNNNTHENDIALLKIAGPINLTNARPIKLVSDYDISNGAIDPGVMAWVTGWGLTNVSQQTLPLYLQKVQLPIVSDAQASTVWPVIPVTDIMAGYLNGNKDACNGDSGGPLAVPVFTDLKLAGIVSWGSPDCNTYGAYSNVSVLESWIRSNTGIPKEYTPPSPTGDSIICPGTDSSFYSVENLPPATSFEWQISPPAAGTIRNDSINATVIWAQNFTGPATLWFRATINDTVSEWSRLNVNIVLNTILTGQSQDRVICAGMPVILNVYASGHDLVYSWYRDSNLVQTGPASTLSIPATTTTNTGVYKCNVSGTCGTLFSGNINLTVHPLTSITYISPDTAVNFGSNVTLNVEAEGYQLNYIWEKDGKLLINDTASQFIMQNVNAGDIGIYQSVVTGYCGKEISDSIYLYVKKKVSNGEPQVFLWPTIVREEVNLALSNDDYYNIRIFSIQGKLMKELPDCRYRTVIDINDFAAGIYIVEVSNKNFRKTLKLMRR